MSTFGGILCTSSAVVAEQADLFGGTEVGVYAYVNASAEKLRYVERLITNYNVKLGSTCLLRSP